MKRIVFLMVMLNTRICFSQSSPENIFIQADSIYELGQWKLAADRFVKARTVFRSQQNWSGVLRCLDAERACYESMQDWPRALRTLQFALALNRDTLQQEHSYSSVFYKGSAIIINAQSLEYFAQSRKILIHWKGAENETSLLTWYVEAGRPLLIKTFSNEVSKRLRSDFLLIQPDTHEKKTEQELKKLAGFRIPESDQSFSANKLADQYFTKALVNRDSSLWYLYKATYEWLQQGRFDTDSVYLAFVKSWSRKEPDNPVFHRLLGWYAEQHHDYVTSLQHYQHPRMPIVELQEFILRNAKAYVEGSIVYRHVTTRDTADAHQLTKKALKLTRKDEFFASAYSWADAAYAFVPHNCWDRAYHCFYQSAADALKDDVVSVRDFGPVDFSLRLAQLLFPEGSMKLARANLKTGLLFFQWGENHRALEALRKAVPVFEMHKADAQTLSNLYLALGTVSRNLFDFESAIQYHEKALQISIPLRASAQLTFNLHQHLVEEYYESGDYEAARQHLESSKKLLPANQTISDEDAEVLKYREGLLLAASGNHAEAVTVFEECLRPLNNEKFHEAYAAYIESNYSEKSYEEVNKSMAVQWKNELRIKLLMSLLYSLQFSDPSGIPAYIRSLTRDLNNQIVLQALSIKTIIESENLLANQILLRVGGHNQLSPGNMPLVNQQDTTVLQELDQALEKFTGTIRLNCINNYSAMNWDEETLDNPPLVSADNPDVNSYQFPDLFLSSYLGRAKVYFQFFRYTSDTSYLYKAEDQLERCDSILYRTRKYNTQESIKLRMAEAGAEVYELGTWVSIIQAIKSPYMRNRAFEFMEKGKSGILRQSLSEANAQYYSGVPDSLITAEKNSKLRLFDLKRRISEYKGDGNDEGALDELENLLVAGEQSYQHLTRFMQETYPRYYNAKYQEFIPSSYDLAQTLKPDEAIVEFLVGQESVFICYYRPGMQFNFTVRKVDSLFTRHIVQLRKSLIFQLKEPFKESSTWLYDRLFRQIDEYFTKSGAVKNLIIIADNVLGYIPFETLMPENSETDYPKMPFLIKKYSIRYAYSASTFVEHARYNPMTEDSAFVAFAPVFNNKNNTNFLVKSCERFYQDASFENEMTRAFSRDGKFIAPLPYTEQEVKTITRYLREKNLFADYFVFEDAREEVLKSPDLQRYKYIHMATHGMINDQFPDASGLLLTQDSASHEDGILYAAEIYALKLNADLVVLSACETGLGKVVKGEGIIGLTRGWLYAGAKNLIVSLWKVADQSTSELMIDFYNALLSGGSKASALQHAKLNMINDSRYSAPYYWAPFILLGK